MSQTYSAMCSTEAYGTRCWKDTFFALSAASYRLRAFFSVTAKEEGTSGRQGETYPTIQPTLPPAAILTSYAQNSHTIIPFEVEQPDVRIIMEVEIGAHKKQRRGCRKDKKENWITDEKEKLRYTCSKPLTWVSNRTSVKIRPIRANKQLEMSKLTAASGLLVKMILINEKLNLKYHRRFMV